MRTAWMHTRRGARIIRKLAIAWKRLRGERGLCIRNRWAGYGGVGKIAACAFDCMIYRAYWGEDLSAEIEGIEASRGGTRSK